MDGVGETDMATEGRRQGKVGGDERGRGEG